jgi:hypothetical protein
LRSQPSAGCGGPVGKPSQNGGGGISQFLLLPAQSLSTEEPRICERGVHTVPSRPSPGLSLSPVMLPDYMAPTCRSSSYVAPGPRLGSRGPGDLRFPSPIPAPRAGVEFPQGQAQLPTAGRSWSWEPEEAPSCPPRAPSEPPPRPPSASVSPGKGAG